MPEIETLMSIFLVVNTAINASVWYRMGSIEKQVKSCENFKVSPKN